MADDDKSIQKVVSKFLGLMGFEVALAGNGLEAPAAFLENAFDKERIAR